MSRYFKYFFFAFLLTFIQTKVMTIIALEGITPDLLLIWLVYIAINNGQLTGTVWGFIIGMMFDLATGNFIGLSALSKTIAGFVAGYFYGENKAAMTLGSYRYIIIVLLTSVIHNSIYFAVFTRGSEIGLWRAIFQYGLASTFYTAAVTLLPMFIFARKYIR
jgi:rod shape-determining protein MreD